MKTCSAAAIHLALKLQWQLASMADTRRVHEIHVEVLSELPLGTVRLDDMAHFERHTGQDGLILTCTANDEHMIAYGVLGFSSDTTTQLGDLLRLDQTERARFAILDGVAVVKSWRGLHLHQQSLIQRTEHARMAGRTLIGVTVAPNNTVSMHGLLKAGFTITGLSMIYNGLDRLILKRDLNRTDTIWRPEMTIESSDVAAHRGALMQGLQGFGCSRSAAGEWQVQYGTAEQSCAPEALLKRSG